MIVNVAPIGANNAAPDIVYRALTPADVASIEAGTGIAAKAPVGDYAAVKLAEAQTLLDSASSEPDPVKRAQLYQQAHNMQDNWGEGGAAKVALHTAVGGLTGGMGGALGAGAAALTMQAIAARLEDLDLPESVKKALILSAGATIGAAGALTSLNEIDNNYLSHKRPAGIAKLSEQEQFDKAVAACSSGDKGACETRDSWIKISQARDQTITKVCAGGPSSDCSALIHDAFVAGNKVMFGSDKKAVVYKLGSPEISFLPGVGEGSFHYTLANSALDGLLMEAEGLQVTCYWGGVLKR